MGTIAKGEIALSTVNDAYTVLLTPASCSISADFDGSHPVLTNAKGTITITRGAKAVPFKIINTAPSDSKIKVAITSQTPTAIQFAITQIANTVLDGNVKFNVMTQDGSGYVTDVVFVFNVVRESTMLDWIQDWDSTKTSIGDSYVITPKIFVGKNVPDGADRGLTGVYIGPAGVMGNSTGIFGYKNSREIFHINEEGGYIGGWAIHPDGMQSRNGVVNIWAEGSIYATNPASEAPYWGIYADGHAIFANGNVKFMSDGTAEFAGTVKSSAGMIGGWIVSQHQLYNNRVILDSQHGLIGINASKIQNTDHATNDVIFPDNPDGGVKMWYNSAVDFGLAAWSTGVKVLQIGSVNFLAGWRFNHQAMWFGTDTPALSQGSYTTVDNAITISPNGIRSSKWYIDANGTASFVGGHVNFNTGNATMFGWLMRPNRFSAKHAALISSAADAGMYVSVADLSEVNAGSIRSVISNNGGVYMHADDKNAVLRAYDKSGKVGFALNIVGENTIASWKFNHTAIYIGTNKLGTNGFTVDSGSMVLSTTGIVGHKWQLLADGSGAIAGGHIKWDAQGKVTLDSSVSLSWSQITDTASITDRLTHIDAAGIYTGTISANKITAGTISSASIECRDKWQLNQDGSGYLASHNITWDTKGELELLGSLRSHAEGVAVHIGHEMDRRGYIRIADAVETYIACEVQAVGEEGNIGGAMITVRDKPHDIGTMITGERIMTMRVDGEYIVANKQVLAPEIAADLHLANAQTIQDEPTAIDETTSWHITLNTKDISLLLPNLRADVHDMLHYIRTAGTGRVTLKVQGSINAIVRPGASAQSTTRTFTLDNGALYIAISVGSVWYINKIN